MTSGIRYLAAGSDEYVCGDCPGPPGALTRPSRFPQRICFVALLYGRTRCQKRRLPARAACEKEGGCGTVGAMLVYVADSARSGWVRR